jgi:hypothetical protein
MSRIALDAPSTWHSMFRRLASATIVCLLAAAGCGGGSGKSSGAAGTTGGAGTTGSAGSAGGGGTAGGGSTGGPGPVDASADSAPIPFEEQVLEIAANYISWGRVDDELRWAPGLCRQPLPGVAKQSASDDPNTHGQKLYSVFAKRWAQYPNGPHDGQAVVKQSWKVEAVTTPDAAFTPGMFPIPNNDGDHFYAFAKGPDGGVFRATDPAGLYIMFKLDPATPETDEGWVYATVSTVGQVTSAGRVASCMGCHETSATHERLYGVPKSNAF